jgi:hypothetical protein
VPDRFILLSRVRLALRLDKEVKVVVSKPIWFTVGNDISIDQWCYTNLSWSYRVALLKGPSWVL